MNFSIGWNVHFSSRIIQVIYFLFYLLSSRSHAGGGRMEGRKREEVTKDTCPTVFPQSRLLSCCQKCFFFSKSFAICRRQIALHPADTPSGRPRLSSTQVTYWETRLDRKWGFLFRQNKSATTSVAKIHALLQGVITEVRPSTRRCCVSIVCHRVS